MCTSSNYQPQPVSPVSATVQPSVGGAETKPGLTPLVVLPGLTANGQGIPLRNFEGANDEPVDFFGTIFSEKPSVSMSAAEYLGEKIFRIHCNLSTVGGNRSFKW